jgi:pimeloyl-ACP methyl ester carboxylesterase
MPFVNNNGIKIHYEVEGQGPALLLAHGLSTSMEQWRARGYTEELSGNHMLILVDTRGHGGSDKPITPESYRPDVVAGDYVAVLDSLGIEKTNYFGYSMVGKIGFSCLAHYALPISALWFLAGLALTAWNQKGR